MEPYLEFRWLYDSSRKSAILLLLNTLDEPVTGTWVCRALDADPESCRLHLRALTKDRLAIHINDGWIISELGRPVQRGDSPPDDPDRGESTREPSDPLTG